VYIGCSSLDMHTVFIFCRSGYSKHPNKQPWVLTRVSGEPLSAEPLEAITPGNPPEAVVAAQVQAFRCGCCWCVVLGKGVL
jgi:hypothetical protein